MRSAIESYRLLLRWQVGRLRTLLPLLVLVQTLLATGLIVGLGMLIPDDQVQSILYLATGAPTVALITVGLVVVPLQVSQAKAEGSIDFMWSLPVPRLAYLAADLTLWLLVSLPGMVLSIVVAAWRYDLPFTVSPSAIGVVLLVALTATSLGYAVAAGLPPIAAQLVSQALVFGVLMFSPINYPAERLPGWIAAIHDILPIESMGQVIRHAIAPDAFPFALRPYLVLAAYCVLGLLLTQRLMTRRQ